MVPPVLGDDPIGEDVVLVGPHHSVPIVRPFGDVLEGGLAGHRAGDGGGARVAVQDTVSMARVMPLSGEKVVALVPLKSPFSTT